MIFHPPQNRDYLRSSRGLATKWPKNACLSKPTTTTTTPKESSDLSPAEIGQSSAQTFELRPSEILTYAWQVAKGMNYLAGMKVNTLLSCSTECVTIKARWLFSSHFWPLSNRASFFEAAGAVATINLSLKPNQPK